MQNLEEPDIQLYIACVGVRNRLIEYLQTYKRTVWSVYPTVRKKFRKQNIVRKTSENGSCLTEKYYSTFKIIKLRFHNFSVI